MIVGLDIGTTKVCAVIGERNESGVLEITGVGVSPSTGLRKGVVVNIEATLRSVSAAIEAAEMMSGREVHACWTGIGGAHIEGLNSRGVVAVTGKGKETREIGQEDIDRVIEAARAVVIPMDRQVLHVIPQTYIVDDQKGIRNPLDMIGVRLEAEVHIITGSLTSAQNLVKCVNRAGFRVSDLILQPLAAARSVLTAEERELGVALIDLGGGTTDIVVFADGAPYFTTTVPVGGTQVTSDLSIVKNLSFETAERIKLEAGCCWEPMLEGDEDVIVPGVGGRPPMPIPRSQICQIVQARMEEILRLAKEKIDKLALDRPLGGGVVLSGGGSQLVGVAELASSLFRLPVRVGVPMAVGGLVEEYRSPVYATAVGLVLEGAERDQSRPGDKARPGERGRAGERGSETRGREKGGAALFGKLAEWLKKEFF